jgi:hypothetical protein
MSDEEDKLFTTSRTPGSGFRLDEQVVKVFPGMIARYIAFK